VSGAALETVPVSVAVAGDSAALVGAVVVNNAFASTLAGKVIALANVADAGVAVKTLDAVSESVAVARLPGAAATGIGEGDDAADVRNAGEVVALARVAEVATVGGFDALAAVTSTVTPVAGLATSESRVEVEQDTSALRAAVVGGAEGGGAASETVIGDGALHAAAVVGAELSGVSAADASIDGSGGGDVDDRAVPLGAVIRVALANDAQNVLAVLGDGALAAVSSIITGGPVLPAGDTGRVVMKVASSAFAKIVVASGEISDVSTVLVAEALGAGSLSVTHLALGSAWGAGVVVLNEAGSVIALPLTALSEQAHDVLAVLGGAALPASASRITDASGRSAWVAHCDVDQTRSILAEILTASAQLRHVLGAVGVVGAFQAGPGDAAVAVEGAAGRPGLGHADALVV